MGITAVLADITVAGKAVEGTAYSPAGIVVGTLAGIIAASLVGMVALRAGMVVFRVFTEMMRFWGR